MVSDGRDFVPLTRKFTSAGSVSPIFSTQRAASLPNGAQLSRSSSSTWRSRSNEDVEAPSVFQSKMSRMKSHHTSARIFALGEEE